MVNPFTFNTVTEHIGNDVTVCNEILSENIPCLYLGHTDFVVTIYRNEIYSEIITEFHTSMLG